MIKYDDDTRGKQQNKLREIKELKVQLIVVNKNYYYYEVRIIELKSFMSLN